MELTCRSVGDETLAIGPGTIIRSDGIVATSASRLTPLKIKELEATVGNQTLYFFSFIPALRIISFSVSPTTIIHSSPCM